MLVELFCFYSGPVLKKVGQATLQINSLWSPVSENQLLTLSIQFLSFFRTFSITIPRCRFMERDQQTAQLSEILEGYQEFCDFDFAELQLIEALRTLRIMHYSAWLARRWTDPAFPKHFPWFNTERYWAEHILELREQLAALQEPPLTIF